jgi:hypothetical protein
MPPNPIPKIKGQKVETLLEKIGIRYFSKLSKQLDYDATIHLKNIPSDKVLQVVANNITLNTVIIAFLVGALTTVPAVLFETYYRNSFATLHYYLWLSLITVVLLVIEVGILYWLGMRSTYTLAQITGYEGEHENELPPEYDIKNMMVRSALELSDPTIEYLGINPHKYVSKKWIFITAILYKAKIVLSSILIKFILQKIASRYGVRMGFVWVSIPVTAIWDAIVMYHVIKDARLRLFGYHLSKYIIDEVLTDEVMSSYSPHTQEGAIRAVSTMMVLAKSYHPNNIILLIRLSQNFDISEAKDYDELDKFLQHLQNSSKEEKMFLKTLVSITAVFDGKLTKTEKTALVQIFDTEEQEYLNFTKKLQFLLLNNRLHESARLCKEKILLSSQVH